MPANGQPEIRLRGVPLSEGCTVARVCLFNEKRHSGLPLYRLAAAQVEGEVARFHAAVDVAEQRLEAVRRQVEEKIGAPEAGIFMAQAMILRDATLGEGVTRLIRTEQINAEAAVARVLDEYEARLQALDNAYIRERASDFGEVKRRLLDVLGNMRPSLECAGTDHCQRGRNRIVVAEEMTPALTVDLDMDRLMGIVTERGGPTSHGAILARALGIPAVSGLAGVRGRIACGTEILVNGATGEVVIWPGESTIARARATREGGLRLPAAAPPLPGFAVMANISSCDDVRTALDMRAEGIGLYRTEMELIAAGRLLSEDELLERYAAVREAMRGQAVVFRLFDLGSDKPADFLRLPAEGNPALGLRGVRLLLQRPELLRAQARALVRLAARGAPVDVLYPMVIDAAQFDLVRRRFDEATAGLPRAAVRHGAMIEVPAACLDAEALLREADFASIGTNDLAQYLFAVDRGNELVAGDYQLDRPAFWEVIRGVVAAARRAGKPLSVCGELAGDPRYVTKLRALGIDRISVNPRQIPAVRAVAGGTAEAQEREGTNKQKESGV